MASGEFDAKRRKINDLRFSVPLCSQGALGAIRKQIANHGLPENHKRFAMWKETKEFLEDASMSKKQKQSLGRVLLRQCCTSTFCPYWQACSAKGELSQIFSCNFMQAGHLDIVNLGPRWPMQTKCILATCSTAFPGKLGASTCPF